MSDTLPKMFVDQARPGIVRFSDDPLTGILVGQLAPLLVEACNGYSDAKSKLEAATKQLVAAEALSNIVSKWLMDEATYDDLDAAHRAYESASNG